MLLRLGKGNYDQASGWTGFRISASKDGGFWNLAFGLQGPTDSESVEILGPGGSGLKAFFSA